MRNVKRLEFKVGLFINLGIALLIAALFMLGSGRQFFSPKNGYYILLPNAGGLLRGAKVLLGGVPVGTVDDFDLKSNPGTVRVTVSISREFAPLIHTNTTAEVLTEGVVGDRVIALSHGDPAFPQLQPGGVIGYRRSVELGQVLRSSDELLRNLNTLATNLNESIKKGDLSQSLRRLNRILAKIDRGSGTLSELINDPDLYDNAKALFGEANENRIVRNLVRKTVEDSEKKQK